MSVTGVTPSRWTWSGLARAAAIAGASLFAGAALGYVVSHERPPAGSPAPPASAPRAGPSDAELAILSPLRQGSTLGGYDVAEIQPIGSGGVLRLVCRKDQSTVRLDVALVQDGGPPSPATAGRYAVFYGLERADSQDGARLSQALAAILEANAAAPVPRGMTPFVPSR